MTFEQIMTLVVAIAPSIAAIVGSMVALIKNMGSNKQTSKEITEKFEEVRQEIFNTKEYSELKEQLAVAHKENYELQKKLNKLLTQITKINTEE